MSDEQHHSRVDMAELSFSSQSHDWREWSSWPSEVLGGHHPQIDLGRPVDGCLSIGSMWMRELTAVE